MSVENEKGKRSTEMWRLFDFASGHWRDGLSEVHSSALIGLLFLNGTAPYVCVTMPARPAFPVSIDLYKSDL